jgi:Rad3-related DNA helicase
MVNFKELIRDNGKPAPTEPRMLFQSLRRDKKFEYLRDVQGDVLDEWYLRRNDKDIIIKMNTGSGKTLVGLLILWSRIKENKGPSLYLCPDNYLVSQVKKEADQLGIPYTEFGETNELPLEFSNSSAILITNVHKLFNGLSVFGNVNKADFVKVGSIIVDDAHTCINIARQQFTATFSRDSIIGAKIYSFFVESLKQQSVGMSSDIDARVKTALMQVPYWTWQENYQSIAQLFSAHDNELKFVWPFLREGYILKDCVCVISGEDIEISPILLPINLIPSFHKSSSRVFMSATLVDDAAVIKQFSASKESVLNPIRPKVSGDIGERMIIAPSLVDPVIEETATIDLVNEVRSKHNINIVVLVPSTYRSQIWANQGLTSVTRENIADAMKKLSTSKGNAVVFINRYDGIDLPDDFCRLLVIDGLPLEPELRRRLEASERQGSPILRREIAQRIEQGLGRGVRSRTDHCVVILMRNELISFLFKVENQQFLTGETRAQISLGQRLAKIIKGEGENT